jgi:hypothetical protein
MAGILQNRSKLISSRGKVMSFNKYISGINLNQSTDYTHIGSAAGLDISDTTVNSFLFSFIFNGPTDVNIGGYNIFQTSSGGSPPSSLRIATNLGGLQITYYSTSDAANNQRIISIPPGIVSTGEIINILINKNGNNAFNWTLYKNGSLITTTPYTANVGVVAAINGSTHYFGTNSSISHTSNANLILFRTGRFNRLLTDTEAKFITKWDGLLPNTVLSSDIIYYHLFKEKNGTTVSDLKSTYPHTIVNANTTLGASNQWVNKLLNPYLS